MRARINFEMIDPVYFEQDNFLASSKVSRVLL